MNVAGQQCMACYMITLLHKSEFFHGAYPKGLRQAQSLVTAKLTEGCTCKKQVQRCHTGVASNMYVGRYLNLHAIPATLEYGWH